MTDPPQDLLAEQSTLGSMMLAAGVIPTVVEMLKAEDFYRPAHESIFTAIVDLFTMGEPVDAVTVAAELDRRGKLRKIGGAPYLLELIQQVPTAASASSYAQIVAEKAVRRRLEIFGTRCQQLAHAGDSDEVEAVIAQAEEFLREVRQPKERDAMAFSDLVLDWNTWVETGATDDVIPTPWYKVNEMLGGGLYKSRVYVFAGRPGQGKSISVLNVAALAAEQHRSVMIFSLEMPRKEVTSRLLASGAQVSFQQVIRREMRQDTTDRIKHYAATNNGMHLYCVDRVLTVEQMVAHCRAIKDLDLVVIDYAQLVRATDRRIKRHEQIAHVTRTVKVLAKELNVAVALAAQQNRQSVDPKTGKTRVPVLSDLGESGALEADADAVLFLHRPDDDDGTVDIVIAKNRSGLTGIVPLVFVGQQARLAHH